MCGKPYAKDPAVDVKVSECMHISHLMEQSGIFDIIHNNFYFLPLTYSGLIKTPIVTTIHGFSSRKIMPVYKKYNSATAYVSISNSDRSPELDYIATVYNGINTEEFTFNPEPDDYLLYFGRIHPEKGTFESIRIAKLSGRRLIISGLIQDQGYFDRMVKPFINDDDIVFVGNSGPSERDRLLGGAYALLHPISFDEPFGLSVAESMVCGTPMIAFNRGSMPELIADRESGFLVDTVEEAVEAVGNVSYLDRRRCSDDSVSRFSRQTMVKGYLEVYEKILSARA